MRELVERLFRAAKQKDISALDGIFTSDAVLIERSGATFCGIGQIREHFSALTAAGYIAAWDIRKVFAAGEDGAAQWYYEYRGDDGRTVSFDGTALIELSEGRIKRWSEFSQEVNKTYPLN